MRDIKFRVLDKACNCMIGSGSQKVRLMLNGCVAIDSVWATGDIELMQFAGLRDKNGVDIYEGDIVYDDLIGICQVKYNETYAAFKVLHKGGSTAKWFIDYLPSELKCLEVIGNIHQNPELIGDE